MHRSYIWNLSLARSLILNFILIFNNLMNSNRRYKLRSIETVEEKQRIQINRINYNDFSVSFSSAPLNPRGFDVTDTKRASVRPGTIRERITVAPLRKVRSSARAGRIIDPSLGLFLFSPYDRLIEGDSYFPAWNNIRQIVDPS